MRFLFIIAALCFLPGSAYAQIGQKIVIRDGKIVSGGSPAAQPGKPSAAGEVQELMFKAQQTLMKRDYAGAETLYSEVIARDDSNIQAYLHRGVVRREQRDYRGVDADARIALALANNAIRTNPRDPDGYYERSMALRLLRQFDHAKKDVMAAIQLGGKPSLRNDLQAIELERKMALSEAQAAVR